MKCRLGSAQYQSKHAPAISHLVVAPLDLDVEGGVKYLHYLQTDSFRPAPRHVTQPADCTQSQLFFHSIQIFSISADEVISSVSAALFPGHYLCGHQHNSGEAAGTVQFLIVHTTHMATHSTRDMGQFHSTQRSPLPTLARKAHEQGATLRTFANQNRLSLMVFVDKRPNFTSTFSGLTPNEHSVLTDS